MSFRASVKFIFIAQLVSIILKEAGAVRNAANFSPHAYVGTRSVPMLLTLLSCNQLRSGSIFVRSGITKFLCSVIWMSL